MLELLDKCRPLYALPKWDDSTDIEAWPEPEPGIHNDVEALLELVLLARERRAVELRFGLVDGRERDLAEVGLALGVSG
jgi:hypothetical protein